MLNQIEGELQTGSQNLFYGGGGDLRGKVDLFKMMIRIVPYKCPLG